MWHTFGLIMLSVLTAGPGIAQEDGSRLSGHVEALKESGKDPIDFVVANLGVYDLLIFDDALHTAVEPFVFYQRLVKTAAFRKHGVSIFVEAISINQQPHVDAYLRTEPENPSLLYPVFQNDFSGSGWAYQTYFDLLHTIYEVNRGLPADEHLRVIGVSNPTYWSEITTSRDVELFRESLGGFDYTMYRTILAELAEFKAGRKGILLTNTRHAYKGIKDRDGAYFWNCGTFFNQWNPGKTFSIRFHNVALWIEDVRDNRPAETLTTQGLERVEYRWVRMADGLWDSAFAASGRVSVAIPLQGNAFGRERYVGNHMLKAAPGQTMYDAYDAVIFLAPIEALHKTAINGDIYTSQFKRELARRYQILYTEEELSRRMREEQAGTLEELIDKETRSRPQELLPQAKSVGPANAWKASR